jgi:ribonuclease HI
MNYIFTDGGAINNGKKSCIAGIGIYYDNEMGKIDYNENITTKFKKVTNQVAELYACIKK